MKKQESNLYKFNGTFEEFINLIDTKLFTYIKKPNGRKIIQLFYDDSDRWFINEFAQKSEKDIKFNTGEHSWLIEKDMLGYLKYMCNVEGYEMNLMESKTDVTRIESKPKKFYR